VLRELSPLFTRTLVAAVGGNHGENRKGGKAYTSPGDNRDVSAFETVAEVVAEAGDRFGDIAFVLPNEDLTLTLDVAGTNVGLAHGHQATGGGSPETKIMNWWKSQALGGQPIGDARVLFSGHYHHVRHLEDYGRQWFQAPALEGGSRYWTETQGSRSRPGILTAVIDADGARDVAILGRRILGAPPREE
jgi:predicted phosphodiesterase